LIARENKINAARDFVQCKSWIEPWNIHSTQEGLPGMVFGETTYGTPDHLWQPYLVQGDHPWQQKLP